MASKRFSRQRALIYQTLKDSKDHPTAEMIFHALKPDNPSLSLGTVYRNLNLLAGEGLITRMHFSVERYDANTQPHPHFACRRCGRVSDLDLPYDSSLDEAASCTGHQISGHTILFSGLCAECVREEG